MNLFSSMINFAQNSNRVITMTQLYDMYDMSNDALLQIIEVWIIEGVKSCTIILNIRKNVDQTEVTKKEKLGNHWTALFIDFNLNKSIYCESLGWQAPINFKKLFNWILHSLKIVFNAIDESSVLDKHMLIAHTHETLNNQCGHLCLKYTPCQGDDMNICGLACLLFSIILSDSKNSKELFEKLSLPFPG